MVKLNEIIKYFKGNYKYRFNWKIHLLVFIIFILIKKTSNSLTLNNKTNIKRKLNSENYINITIKNKGKIGILNILDEFPENTPSEILLYGKPINFSVEKKMYEDFRYKNKNYERYICYINVEENNQSIIIKWNKTISNMMYMFFDLDPLISIDFTNFDSSSVINTCGLFHSSNSLKSLKLNNFDTSSVTDMNCMFYHCESLISLNLNSFNTSSVSDMRFMFSYCSSLISLDLSNFDTSHVNNMRSLFKGCTKIKFLDIKNFDTSSVIDMSYMFSQCNSLISLDLNNFNTSSVTDMSFMFSMAPDNYYLSDSYLSPYDIDLLLNYSFIYAYNFSILTSLNLNNFDTSSVTNMEFMFSFLGIESLDLSKFNTFLVEKMNGMFLFCTILKSLNITNFKTPSVYETEGMFCGCFSLKSLNLNNFDTFQVISMIYMFAGCKSLISLDLSNFITQSCELYYKMFYNCINLEFINLENFILLENIDPEYYMDIFLNTSEYLVYCINMDSQYSNVLKNLLNSKKCSIHDCSSNWRTKKKKRITNLDICIENCSDLHLFEYNNDCYFECPNETIPSNDYPYLCINASEIYLENSSILQIEEINLDEINKINSLYENSYTKIYQAYIENLIFQIQNNKINNILSNIIFQNNSDYVIQNNDMIIQITSINNQKNNEFNNISKIIIDPKCEKILQIKYNIKKDDNIIILKYDYFIKGLNIPLIGYELFHPITKEKLDLDYCKDINIEINIPISINEGDLYKYNPNSNFYQDICISYNNENKVDMTINERKMEFNKYNMSLCPKNCTLDHYNNLTKRVSCQCEVQTKPSALLLEDIFDTNKILNNFKDTKNVFNINIIKCFKEVISKEGLKTNIGSYILLLIIFFSIILCILFYSKGYIILFNKIEDISNKNILSNNSDTKDNNIITYIDKKDNSKKKSRKKKINNLIISNAEGSKIKINSKNLVNNYKTTKKFGKKKPTTSKTTNIVNYMDCEINSFSYEEALKKDKRNFLQLYISLIKTKHLFFFAFFPVKDYNSIYIKISWFLYYFSLCCFVNALFFTDETMHKIFEDEGIFNFIYLLPQMLYSTIISSIFISFMKYLALPENTIIEMKNMEITADNMNKIKNMKKCIKIRCAFFFIIDFIFSIFFWYYLACFCAIYKNTQIYLLKDILTSFSLSMIYPFIIYLIPSTLRFTILKRADCFYKLSKLTQMI